MQAVTNFATTANGVLASTFLLYSVGLGAGAIPTAGALNWVLKDGLGQMGTLLFGKAIAHNFDIHSKTWYFMSFLLLSTATGACVRQTSGGRGGGVHGWDLVRVDICVGLWKDMCKDTLLLYLQPSSRPYPPPDCHFVQTDIPS
jgi:hypothetical protein